MGKMFPKFHRSAIQSMKPHRFYSGKPPIGGDANKAV